MFNTYYDNQDLIQYHVTRPVVPIVDTDGKGTFNISPIGFPVRNVSGELGINPTLIIPEFTVGYNDVTQNNTDIVANYTNYNTNVSELSEYQTFIETLSSITSVGTTATATSSNKHGYTTGLSVTITGVNESVYNGTFTITVIDEFVFTYVMGGVAVSSTALGLPQSSFTLSPSAANIILEGQLDESTNGFYTSSDGPWAVLVTEGTLYEPIVAYINQNIDLNTSTIPFVVSNSISNISGDGSVVTVITDNYNGYKTGESVDITGTTNFNGTYTIKSINLTTFTFELVTAVVEETTGSADYNVESNSLVNLVAQDDSTENGIYRALSSGWSFWGCFYEWNGTENDNVEGVYPEQINPVTGEVLQPNHYRRGYSDEEVNNWLRSRLETSVEFGKFRGSNMGPNKQGAFVQWLMSGRKVNIGGQGNHQQVFVDGFGLGNPVQTNAMERAGGDVDTSDFAKVLDARTKLSRYNKQALWGLTNHNSRSFGGAVETSPYVKDYPFVYNTEYIESEGIGSGGFIPTIEDAERWILSTPGSSANNKARPLDQSIHYYFRDNSYHNNITLDMNNNSVFGRHNMVINHTLDTQDVIPLGVQYFSPEDVDVNNDTIRVQNGNLYAVNDVIWFVEQTSTLPDGIEEKTTYYITSITNDDITVSATEGGPTLDIGPNVGAGFNAMVRLAFAPYTNYELKGYLDDLVDNSSFSTGIQIIKRVIDGDVVKYYFGQRKKQTLDDIIPYNTGWTSKTLTYSEPTANSIRIYLESTETDYIEFSDSIRTSAELLQTLKDYNNLIPLAFDDSDTNISELQELYVYSDIVDYTDPVNNTAKVRSKKTFVHLPTPVNLDDGTPFELDVSVLSIPDTDPFKFNTVGSLAGYKNYVTQPRVYVLTGTQELEIENVIVDTLVQSDGLATLTTTTNIDIYATQFSVDDVYVESNKIRVIEEFRVGEEIIIQQNTNVDVLPGGLVDGETYIVSSFEGYKVTLSSVNGTPIDITSVGTGANWIIRKADVILCINGAEQDEYNGRVIATVTSRNSFEYSVNIETITPATGNILIEQLVKAEGAQGTKGLTERRNESIFGSNPEAEFAQSDNVYHQTFTPDNIIGNGIDKRTLLATVYPTNTSTFAWRIDNDPQLRVLNWSLLNVNAAGGTADTGSFANVAYKRNLDIVNEFGQNEFDFSVYANPLSYNTNLSPTQSQQHMPAYLRVLLPQKLAPQTESELLSEADYKTVGSYIYQGGEALKDLMRDFMNGSVRVNSRDDDSNFQADAKSFEHGYDGNHGAIDIPTSFYDQSIGQEFIKYNITELPNNLSDNGYRWITKGLYSPDYIVNAEGNTAYPLLDSYNGTDTAFKDYLSFYFDSDIKKNNAGNRYVPGELNPITDPTWLFGADSTQKFIKFLSDSGKSDVFISDVQRRFWDSSYVIPSGEDRQIQNIFQINNTDDVLDITKFHGMHWLPFARVFSADYEVPPEINIVDIDDYATITGGSYPEVANTLGKTLESNPIAQRFYEDGYDESFVSANTSNSNSDLEEFLRNYITGYSNYMPYRFYNNFRTIVSGDTNVTGNSSNTTLTEINTEMDVTRIYKFSTRDYLEQYGDTAPSVDIGRYIDDNFTLNNVNLDGTNVVAEDYNPVWMYFENGNPNTDAVNSTIKNLIVVSGHNYLADREFYREKMLYNYTRVKLKFVFSRKLGRWITLDYRQVPTSFLTPTIGSVAFDEKEKSVKEVGESGNSLDGYIQTILPSIEDTYNVVQLVEEGGAYDRVTFISNNSDGIFTSGDSVMVYVPQKSNESNSPQDPSKTIYTTVASTVSIVPFGSNTFAHTVELNDILNDLVNEDTIKIAFQVDTLANNTFPLNNITQLPNTDFIWNRDKCEDSSDVYKQLESIPYFKMIPNELNRGVIPYLSPSFPYDSNGDRVVELNPEIDSSGAESYRLQRLIEPQKDSPSGINYKVPNNVHGAKIDSDEDLFLFQPHTWKTYWHIRPCVSVMEGTDIPSRNGYTGGVMADPVLNDMFYWPNPRNIQYAIPWHEGMSQNWFDGGLLLIDADRNTFDGCTSLQIDADVNFVQPVNPQRPGYPRYDANRFNLGG